LIIKDKFLMVYTVFRVREISPCTRYAHSRRGFGLFTLVTRRKGQAGRKSADRDFDDGVAGIDRTRLI